MSTLLSTQTYMSHNNGDFGGAMGLLDMHLSTVGMRMIPCLSVDGLQQPPAVLLVLTTADVCLMALADQSLD